MRWPVDDTGRYSVIPSMRPKRMACQISINFVWQMLGADWRQGKNGMKFARRNMSIGHYTSAEACKVGFE